MRNGPYILVKAPIDYPGKKYRGRYVYEHQSVWWQNTKEVVQDGYLVHHINENKHDNRFENLEISTISKHSRQHAKVAEYISCECGWCKCKFSLKQSVYRTRTKTKDKVFCSRSCGAKHQWNILL